MNNIEVKNIIGNDSNDCYCVVVVINNKSFIVSKNYKKDNSFIERYITVTPLQSDKPSDEEINIIKAKL